MGVTESTESPSGSGGPRYSDALLRAPVRWLGWRYKQRPGKPKPDKQPIRCSGIRRWNQSDATDPANWSTFEQAVIYYREHGLDGIGYAMTEDDDLVGVDLDDCVDPETGRLTFRAWSVLQALKSYSEISPSGRGIRIFVEGRVPGDRCKGHRIEIYSKNQFLTITGNNLSDCPVQNWSSGRRS